MDLDASTPMAVAPCGCQFGLFEDVFVIEPCSDNCVLKAYMVAEGMVQNKPVTHTSVG